MTIRIHNWQKEIKVHKTCKHIHNDKKERTKRTSLHRNTSLHFTTLHTTTLHSLTFTLCCSSNIPHPERIAGCPAPDLQQPATKASHTIGGNNTYILELLLMGIEVPETCFAYYKCNKPFIGIWLVFLLYAYATLDGQTYIKFLCNTTYCSYTATVVALARLNVTLYALPVVLLPITFGVTIIVLSAGM